MDWDHVKRDWNDFRGNVQRRWRKLSDTDLQWIAGDRGRFVGRMQRRYAISRIDAERQVEHWGMLQGGSDRRMNEGYTDDGNPHPSKLDFS